MGSALGLAELVWVMGSALGLAELVWVVGSALRLAELVSLMLDGCFDPGPGHGGGRVEDTLTSI